MKLRASLAKKSDKIVHVFTFDGHVWSPGFTIGIQTIQCSLVQKPGAVTLNTVHHHMRKLAEKKKKGKSNYIYCPKLMYITIHMQI